MTRRFNSSWVSAAFRLCALLLSICSSVVFPARADAREAVLTTPPRVGAKFVSAAPVPGVAAWALDWHFEAQGDLYKRSGRDSTKATRRIEITGSARVREGEDGFMVAQPFQLTVTDEREETQTWHGNPTSWFTTRERITDPARYMGGPDQFFVHPFAFEPQPQDDGTWLFPPDVFGLDFFINGDLNRAFTYRTDMIDSRDGPLEPMFFEWSSYATILLNQPGTSVTFDGIPGQTPDAFSLVANYVAAEESGEMPLKVQATISVRRLGGCHAQPAPIDADDPVLTSVDVTLDTTVPEILPDGEASIRAKVTCDGVPVKGARLSLGGYVREESGGHDHGSMLAAAERPRGYLNGVKITPNNWVETTTVRTRADGTATFKFRPGKDTRNNAIGIAGTYVIHAYAFEYRQGKGSIAIVARVPGLRELALNSPNYWTTTSWMQQGHYDHLWGTPATLNAVASLAHDFVDVQKERNAELIAAGKPALPISKLWVDDISLRDGGLFDVMGWDNTAGKVRGAPWQPPHYTHRDGTVVDFKTRNFLNVFPSNRFTAKERDYYLQDLRTALRILGRQYGTWMGGPTMTLRAAQNAQHALQAAIGPNPAVDSFLIDLEDHPSVAIGQSVRVALAPHNYDGTTDASNAVLTASIPAGLRFRDADPAPTRMDAGKLVWELDTLPANRIPHPINLTLDVDASVRAGTTLTVTTQISAPKDSEPDDNRTIIEVVARPAGPDLVVTSSLGHTPVTADAPTPFVVDVANWGTAPSTQTQLTVTVPPTFTVQSSVPPATRVGQQLRWELGPLATNASRAVTITTMLNPGLPSPSTPMLDVSVVATTTQDIDLENNRYDVRMAAERSGSDLVVDLTDGGIDDQGDRQFFLHYANVGNQIAPSSTISVSLASGLSVVAAQPQPTRTQHANWQGGVLNWKLGNVEPGEEATIILHVRVGNVPRDGSMILAIAHSTSADINGGDNAATALIAATLAQQRHVYLPMVRR